MNRSVRVGLVAATLLAVLAGCGDAKPHVAQPPRLTLAQFDTAPCSLTTNAALADALSDEYAEWKLRPTGKPEPETGAEANPKCTYTLVMPHDGGTLEFLHQGHGDETMRVCRDWERSHGAPTRLVKIGDEGCVDDMSFVSFRVGADYFAVTTNLINPETGGPDKEYQPLTLAAARYFLSRLRIS